MTVKTLPAMDVYKCNLCDFKTPSDVQLKRHRKSTHFAHLNPAAGGKDRPPPAKKLKKEPPPPPPTGCNEKLFDTDSEKQIFEESSPSELRKHCNLHGMIFITK